jgi:hypothetical protein
MRERTNILVTRVKKRFIDWIICNGEIPFYGHDSEELVVAHTTSSLTKHCRSDVQCSCSPACSEAAEVDSLDGCLHLIAKTLTSLSYQTLLAHLCPRLRSCCVR